MFSSLSYINECTLHSFSGKGLICRETLYIVTSSIRAYCIAEWCTMSVNVFTF